MYLNNNYTNDEPLLFICAKNKNYFMIEFLIRNNVDINSNFRGEYLLTLLIKNGVRTDFLRKLIIKYNANINIYDSENNHLIFLLLKNQYYNLIYYIIYNRIEESDGFDLNLTNRDNEKLIYVFLDLGLIDLALYIINKGANINCYNNRGDPIIFKFIRDKKYNIVNTLINTGKIDFYSKNKFTNLSLFELLVNENLYILIKYILETKNFIIPYKIVSEEKSLIEIAAKNNNTLILYKLIEYEMARIIQKYFRRFMIHNKYYNILGKKLGSYSIL